MANVQNITERVVDYLENLLLTQDGSFTGKVEFNFKDGELMDGYEKKKILKQKGKS